MDQLIIYNFISFVLVFLAFILSCQVITDHNSDVTPGKSEYNISILIVISVCIITLLALINMYTKYKSKRTM